MMDSKKASDAVRMRLKDDTVAHENDNLPSDSHYDKVELKRRFTLIHGVAILCGFIIGSGIHIAPTGIMREVPSGVGSLLLWIAAGAIATLGALCMAELGTTFPQAGEKYAYLMEMFGDFPAFLQLWQYFLFTRPSSNAIKCILFGQYLVKPFFLDCNIPLPAVQLAAVFLACKY